MYGLGQLELRNPATHCNLNISGFSGDFHRHFSQKYGCRMGKYGVDKGSYKL